MNSTPSRKPLFDTVAANIQFNRLSISSNLGGKHLPSSPMSSNDTVMLREALSFEKPSKKEAMHRNSCSSSSSKSNNNDDYNMDNENPTTSSSEDEDDDDTLSLQLARSSALVGENVLDSSMASKRCHPHHHNYHNQHQHQTNHNHHNFHRHYPYPHHHHRRSNKHHRHGSSSSSSSSLHIPRHPSNAASPIHTSDDVSVGLMAQGLAWVRRQRDRRQRSYLQNQAEQQLRKLRQATATVNSTAMSNADADATIKSSGISSSFSTSFFDNPTFLSLANLTNIHNTESSSSFDYPTLHRNAQRNSHNTLAAMVSQSGDGYTVKLPVKPEEDEEDDASFIPPVRVHDPGCDTDSMDESDSPPPFILSSSQMHQIATVVLPRGISYCKWTRLYSLARDGDAFDACLHRLHGHKYTLMVIRTSRNYILGGFADEPWETGTLSSTSFFGGTDACLFTFANAENKLKCYKWTGINRYVMLCDVHHKMIAFGGGGDNGNFGLCVEKDFQVGSTGCCATFNNEQLCDPETFEIIDLEIYGFLIGQF